ncbi:hypothetical protein BO78DRAFT_373867 [Aspergillus sclerotiicarbonarius CBS 121057]|uniref:F-box domain-containing protein n=1 Tax=Aspergillus sclerotiicarbonarius (strain CBS 121057 / IBT 28362) TaxID=1448318 RepID=A0A319E7J9_ASPSB|nr:hypothetical protein BO78DRAFT_373867 [Aspergillus sclerotiicarbonarius CBS 121057]
MPYTDFDSDDYGSNECYIEEIDDYGVICPRCCICSYNFRVEIDHLFNDRYCTEVRKGIKPGLCKADKLEDLSAFMQKGWWTLRRMNPVRTRCVSEAVGLNLKQADRTQLKKKAFARQATRRSTCRREPQYRLSYLPWEILHMVFGYLASQEVANVEQACGIQCGDTFWRSRISARLFHEITDLNDEDPDWRRLCLQLEGCLGESEALATRQFLLTCLDGVLEIARRQTEVESN